MDTQDFGRIARSFASRRSRCAALKSGAGMTAATALPPRAARATAQEATPVGAPEVMTSTDPHPSAGAPPKTEYLFVQPFAGGSWAPKPGEDGVFTLTLTGAPASTIYFSDRPKRLFGTWPTQQFLDRLGFTPANPPNAALVARPPDGGDDQEVLVIELFNPAYDEAAGTLTYDARVLADYDEPGLAHAARQQVDYELPETFAAGGLFVDGCPDACAVCYKVINDRQRGVGPIYNVPRCDNCEPCYEDVQSEYYGKRCSEAYPSHCSYTCDGTSCSWDCFAYTVDPPC